MTDYFAQIKSRHCYPKENTCLILNQAHVGSLEMSWLPDTDKLVQITLVNVRLS